MRKICVLAMALTLLLCACGSTGEGTSPQPETTVPVTAPTDPPPTDPIPTEPPTTEPPRTEDTAPTDPPPAEPMPTEPPQTEPPEPSPEGRWRWSFSMDGETLLEGFRGSVEVTVSFTLRDGAYRIGMDEEATRASVEACELEMVGYMEEILYLAAEEEGLTREDADIVLEFATGQTVREAAQEAVEDLHLADTVSATVEAEQGSYRFGDGTLCLTPEGGTEEVYGFTAGDGVLILTGAVTELHPQATEPMTLSAAM